MTITLPRVAANLDVLPPNTVNIQSKNNAKSALGEQSPMQDNVLVSFRNVQKTYDGEALIVKDLNLDIRKGEFLTLLGPSGSGKTTCLMMLAGFEYPTGGEIHLDGQLLNKIPPHKRNIGMVFQNYALFPHMTVAQNVEYPLRVRKMNTAERLDKVKRALDMVQMGKFGSRFPTQLSGGQQQRIALARALVFEPKLVLMDEPLGALDKQLRERMQLELKALHQSLKVTFVYVTHDQSEALTMSDRVAVFDQGVIQQIDTVDTLYEAPTNLFVANFIGDSNQLRGEVVEAEGAYCRIQFSNGTSVRGLNLGKVSVGRAATAVVRPERLMIGAPLDDELDSLPTEVLGVIYFGDHVRVRCKLPDGSECYVKVPLGRGGHAQFDAGQRISLAFNPEHVRVF